jgi:hypothetical protein
MMMEKKTPSLDVQWGVLRQAWDAIVGQEERAFKLQSAVSLLFLWNLALTIALVWVLW